MGMVLWIDRNTFATGLVEKIYRKKNLDFYTIPEASDFAYLVEDLKPEVIVVDSATILENLEAFRLQYEGSQTMKSCSFIVIGDWKGLEFISGKKGILPRKFDPFEIPAMISQILGV